MAAKVRERDIQNGGSNTQARGKEGEKRARRREAGSTSGGVEEK